MRAFFRPISSGSASVLLAAASLISYVAGLLRDVLMSNYFGATVITDAYNTAFLIPDLIYTLTTAGALSGIFLPIFRSVNLKDQEESSKLAGSFLVLGQVMVLVLSVIAFLIMPWLVETFFARAPEPQLIINMSRILLVSPIVFSLSNTFGSILMTFKHYLAYAFSAAFYNVGIIAGLVIFEGELGIYSVVVGVLIGLALHLGLRLIDFSFLDFKVKFSWYRPGIKKIASLAAPKTVGLLVWQLSLWAYNIIGTGMLAAGSIAAFYYARNIQSFAVSLFGIAVATAVFPFIVDFKERNQTKELVQKIESTLLQILVFTVPAAVGLALLDTEVVTALLGRGEFDEKAIVLTSAILFFFAFSIPFESMTHLFARIFYAFHNTLIPVGVNLLFLAINLGGSFYFAVEYGAKAFSIFFAIASAIQVSLLILFVRRFVKLHFGFLIIRVVKILGASGVMGLLVYLARENLDFGLWIDLGLSVLVGVASYFFLLYIMDMLRYTGLRRIKLSMNLMRNRK